MNDDFIYFKGPSEEKILKRLEGSSLTHKFYGAIKNNCPNIVEQCIKEGYDPSENDNQPIIEASGSGHLNVVKLLLKDPRVDPSAQGNWAIRRAYIYRYPDITKFLLKQPAVLKSLSLEDRKKFKNIKKQIIKETMRLEEFLKSININNLIKNSKN
jgi:hypothetical protein